MNDPSQLEFHKRLPDNGIDLECEVMPFDNGYQAMCPTCPWTSGVKLYKGSVKILYYRHLDYILKGTNG